MDIISSTPSEASVLTPPHSLNHVTQNSPLTPDALQGNERITVALPKSLVERLRNAVYWTENRTMARVIADAVEDAVSEMEQANGGVFPARLKPLRPGRRRHPQPLSASSATASIPRAVP